MSTPTSGNMLLLAHHICKISIVALGGVNNNMAAFLTLFFSALCLVLKT